MDAALLGRRLRILGDPSRLRLLALLAEGEAAVQELVEALNLGQSTVSGHLARLGEEGLVRSRRAGRFLLYSGTEELAGDRLAGAAVAEVRDSAEGGQDLEALERARARRLAEEPSGGLGQDWIPGRTWEAFGRALLRLFPRLVLADLGVGRGDMTLLLAQRARKVIAIDADERALERLAARAEKAGLAPRLECRVGRIEEPPLEAGEVELYLLSQVLHLLEAPDRALEAAHRALAPGGQILVLDLLAHREDFVRERLGHVHLGFTEADLETRLRAAGFHEVQVERASRDRRPPHFVTLLGEGWRA